MPIEYTNEGDLVQDLIYGRGDNPRDTAPEPSLLPQLGAKLCHDVDINNMLSVTRELARHPANAPPLSPLWEATLWGVAKREDLAGQLDKFGAITNQHWQVIRALQTRDKQHALELAQSNVMIGGDYPDHAGIARLAPILPREYTEQLLDPTFVSPADHDSESLRSILEAAKSHGIEVSEDWLDEALDDNWFGADGVSHLIHVLPSLPDARRATVADDLARKLQDWHLPPDQRAIWVSRIAPFVSSADVWSSNLLVEDLSPVWLAHIEHLKTETWPTELWADVFRAHPAHQLFASVRRPHEDTAPAPQDIADRWGMAHAAMVGPERGGTAPAEEVGPELDSPRRLQANVSHASSGKIVDAFVANQEHQIAVSIGRDGRVQANVDIEHKLDELFRETDAERLDLPVWFHCGDERQQGLITVPRKLSEDSTTHEFSLTAPAAGRVVARVHVMRPGGQLLLQSAALIGDVVENLDAAMSHGASMQLNVDVLAGNLSDPTDGRNGQTLLIDDEAAITRSEGKLIELQLTQMQEQLRKLVSEIEFSADAQDFDDRAMEKTLVLLAINGRAFWKKFQRQLQELADSDYLQIVSLLDDYMLPLELVYDGPALSPGSKLCPTWREALRTGTCPSCSQNDVGHGEPNAVCPLNFWSMSKVIERRLADAKGGTFRIRGERSQTIPELRAMQKLLVSASSRVKSDQLDQFENFLESTLQISARRAQDWSEWTDLINVEKPEILVAMPHNEDIFGGAVSALLLGEPEDENVPLPDNSALMAGSVTSEHVQTADALPGPIVLLLGCDTQYQQGKLSGFAGEFRDNGAALTIGTIGKLRADQASLAARKLLENILRNSNKGAAVGEAIRDARRELLSENLIMALLLVANGDAEWTLPS